MKKNIVMWLFTLIVAVVGIVFAVISFFKNTNFLRHFKSKKNEDNDSNDDFSDETENDDELNSNANSEEEHEINEEESFDYVVFDDGIEDDNDYDVD